MPKGTITPYIELESVPFNFQIPGTNEDTIFSVTAIGGGLINDTYLVKNSLPFGEVGKTTDPAAQFILQRINTNVFLNVRELMINMHKVSLHLQSKSNDHGHCLSIIPTKDGRLFWERNVNKEEKEVWRMLNYISGVSYPLATNNNLLYEAGRAFGKFQYDLRDFSSSELYDTIPDFHNTQKRLEDFRKAVKDDKFDRANAVKEEICYIESKSDLASFITDLMNEGLLPKRVTHNDTKLDNVLFDPMTNKALCVVDYDTIMSGCMLFDFGDGIRSSNSNAESSTDTSKVAFDIDAYQHFTKGFLEEVAPMITGIERECLHMGAIVITFEQTIRFLTDFLLGDVYFKIDYSEQNKIRGRNQMELLKGMLAKKDEMSLIIKNFNSASKVFTK